MSKFNLGLTFQTIYVNNYFLNLVLYWNYIPFINYLILLLNDIFFAHSPVINVVLVGLVILLTILYQLYLWSFSFFTAQDVSMGYFGIPEMSLQDMFTDWGVKFKLVIIRFVYYIPILILGGLVSGLGSGVITQLISSSDRVSIFLSLGMGLAFMAFIIFLAVMVTENFLLAGAFYQYSFNNSIWAAFNLVKVGKFIVVNLRDLIMIFLIQVGFYIGISILGILASLLLIVPIIGAIVISILAGFITSWNVVFIPSLQGQIWHRTEI